MLTGAVLGAFGGAGIARGFNTLRRKSQTVIRWDPVFLQQQTRGVLLRYLAVAHYGRGRGEWQQRIYPEFWHELARKTVADHEQALDLVWEKRDANADAEAIALALTPVLTDMARTALDALYPGAIERLQPDAAAADN